MDVWARLGRALKPWHLMTLALEIEARSLQSQQQNQSHCEDREALTPYELSSFPRACQCSLPRRQNDDHPPAWTSLEATVAGLRRRPRPRSPGADARRRKFAYRHLPSPRGTDAADGTHAHAVWPRQPVRPHGTIIRRARIYDRDPKRSRNVWLRGPI